MGFFPSPNTSSANASAISLLPCLSSPKKSNHEPVEPFRPLLTPRPDRHSATVWANVEMTRGCQLTLFWSPLQSLMRASSSSILPFFWWRAGFSDIFNLDFFWTFNIGSGGGFMEETWVQELEDDCSCKSSDRFRLGITLLDSLLFEWAPLWLRLLQAWLHLFCSSFNLWDTILFSLMT